MPKATAGRAGYAAQGGKTLSECATLFTREHIQTIATERVSTGISELDRSLITRLVENPINRTLVKDLVDICQTYGRNCVAEGVETKDQVDSLLEMGCHCIQGFFYDKPMPAEKFEEKYLRTASDFNR